jgi:hypothetical protein
MNNFNPAKFREMIKNQLTWRPPVVTIDGQPFRHATANTLTNLCADDREEPLTAEQIVKGWSAAQ